MQTAPFKEPLTDPLRNGRESQAISLSQRAYELIRQRIVNLVYLPGSILDENRLQSELKLGRTPIREALLRLSMEKLVTIVPRRGIFVAEIGVTDFQQIFEVRMALESLAARLAAQRGTEANWQRLEQLLESWEASARDASLQNIEILAFDEACHMAIYEAANNRLLQDTLSVLYALSRRLWLHLAVSTESLVSRMGEHRQILEALRRRDSELAGKIIEDHIRAFQDSYQEAFLGATVTNR